MYYEEKVIDGVLHWRLTPTDEFKPFTAEELTDRVIKLQGKMEAARRELAWRV